MATSGAISGGYIRTSD